MASRYWSLLGAVFFLALGLFYAPSLSVRLAIALVGAVLAGICLGYLLRRALTSSPLQTFDVNENPVGDIFALGKLFEATMSGMREGLLVVDRDMRVVASNPAAHQLFILSEGKLDSKRLTELTRNRAIYSAFLEALKGEERSGIKVETHGPDRRIFDLRVVPLRTAGRKGTQGAIGVFFDITRLERLEHVRQEFLSNVSHELRTPLTAILAFVETLEAGGIADQDRQRFLTIIRRNATRMHNLIDDILELSAIEAGNVQVKSEEVELHAVVSDVFISLAARAAARQVLLENEVDREALVFADARRLEQMLTNLIDNAIKFNRDGGRVTVRHENGSSDRVFVEDTGEGIPTQHLQRLFERFYRVDRARSREMGGTGLGLAIVKHLVRAHDGEITVESSLGEGSTFALELPKQRLSG